MMMHGFAKFKKYFQVLPNIIKEFKQRKMRRAVEVTCCAERRTTTQLR
jgi:hypothetical protein